MLCLQHGLKWLRRGEVAMDEVEVDGLGVVPGRAEVDKVVDLQAFKAHAEALQRSSSGFQTEYAATKRLVLSAPDYGERMTPNSVHVRACNRYSDIVCLEDTRARLRTSENDYINASLIDPAIPAEGLERWAKPEYIAAQAPLEATIPDFWRLCLEYRIPVIAMLTPWKESAGGRTRVKAEQYFPLEPGEAAEYGDFKVTCEAMDARDKGRGLVVRKLHVVPPPDNALEPRTIMHVHFTHWPDFGSVSNFGLYLGVHACINKALDQQRRASPGEALGQLLVHCSAGIGRTGTYIAIETLLAQVRDAVRRGAQGKAPAQKLKLDVSQVVANLRNQRPGMVVTCEQYVMIYLVIYYALFRVGLEHGAAALAAEGGASKGGAMDDAAMYRHHLGEV